MIHLHTRSSYSLLESPLRIESIIALAKEAGQSAVALTDHTTMYGTIAFIQAAKEAGLKPIVGLEFDVLYQNQRISLLALAKNTQGLQALFQISTLLCNGAKWIEETIGDLKKNQESNLNSQKESEGKETMALLTYEEKSSSTSQKDSILSFEEFLSLSRDLIVFNAGGDNAFEELAKSDEDFVRAFFQELQQNGATVAVAISLQDSPVFATTHLRRIALKEQLMAIALSRIEYERPKDVELLTLLKAIGQNKRLEDPSLDVRKGRYWRTEKEMEFLYSPFELQNTDSIASLVEEYDLPKASLPIYPNKANCSSAIYLKNLCVAGLQKRLNGLPCDKDTQQLYIQRLYHELDVILSMGFADYFLIVWDFIKEARHRHILAGPGRGSAAGSLVAWCLGITHIDPVANHLLFERFLNPARISMPDIDVDFPDTRRGEIIDYVQDKYHRGHAAHIVTFARFKAKLALRDVAHALGLPMRNVENMISLLPPNLSLQEAYHTIPSFASRIESEKVFQRLFALALSIENLPRHPSIHAGGIVLAKDPIVFQAPLIDLEENLPVVQFSMDYLEAIGLIKFDFLAVRNLSTLAAMVQEIKNETGQEIDLLQLPKDDPQVYALLCQGDTLGIFQLESAGIRQLVMRYQPRCFEDIAAILALYRPGPMKNIDVFLEARFSPQKRKSLHPLLGPLLAETGGIFVYQEQIMEASRLLGGFSLSQADSLRKAMSKKQGDVMESWRQQFVLGAKEKGLEEAQAQSLFEVMEQFAQYGFNKSHSYAYGLIVYQMTWIKARYPLAFYLCNLNAAIGSGSKLQAFLKECTGRKIALLPLSLNHSSDQFVLENKALRLPLSMVKAVSLQTVRKIIEERRTHGPFENPTLSIVRLFKVDLTIGQVRNLIRVGALDELGIERESLEASLEEIHRLASLVEINPQTNLWDFRGVSEPTLQRRPSDPLLRLQYEKELLGLYWTRHPANLLRQQNPLLCSIQDVLERMGPIQSVGVVHSIHPYKNKKGQQMAFAVLSDETGDIDLAFMPWIYEKILPWLKENQLIWIQGNKTRPKSILVNDLRPVLIHSKPQEKR